MSQYYYGKEQSRPGPSAERVIDSLAGDKAAAALLAMVDAGPSGIANSNRLRQAARRGHTTGNNQEVIESGEQVSVGNETGDCSIYEFGDLTDVSSVAEAFVKAANFCKS